MATQLDSAPEWFGDGTKQGRKVKYPWSEWLNGNVWQIIQGEDFTIQMDSMITSIHTAALKRGLKAYTRRDPSNPKALVFRTAPKEEA